MKRTMKHVAICLWVITVAVAVITSSGCSSSQYRRTTGQYLDDQTLTARVKSALIADPNVSGLQVNVDAYQGVVALSGFVDTAAQKARAEELARSVQGVQQVKNNLAVREQIKRSTPGTTR